MMKGKSLCVGIKVALGQRGELGSGRKRWKKEEEGE